MELKDRLIKAIVGVIGVFSACVFILCLYAFFNAFFSGSMDQDEILMAIMIAITGITAGAVCVGTTYVLFGKKKETK